jgi:enterochelin esterase-like enzyme
MMLRIVAWLAVALASALPNAAHAQSTTITGAVFDTSLYSPILGRDMPYRVYLPPAYLQDDARRFPVLYMLHGAGGNYTEWSDSYLPEQADRMIVAGEIPPMILVMPDGGGQTYWANWSDDGPRWADYVVEDVVPTIDTRYRTLPVRTSRAIGGLSMGGMGALDLAFQHPDVFGVVGGHSPSVRLQPDPALWFLADQNFWDNNPIWLAQHQSGLEALQIWLDAGTDDVWLPNIEAVRDALVEQNLHVSWHNFPGPHEAEYWIEHVPDYLQFYGNETRG